MVGAEYTSGSDIVYKGSKFQVLPDPEWYIVPEDPPKPGKNATTEEEEVYEKEHKIMVWRLHSVQMLISTDSPNCNSFNRLQSHKQDDYPPGKDLPRVFLIALAETRAQET